MKIEYSKKFLDDVASLNEKQVKKLKERITLFRESPTAPVLRNHKLKGKLKDFCSINITGDLRAVYIMEKQEKNIIIKFVRLDTHSQLYG